MPYCPKCGTEVTENDIFCPKCGAPIKAVETRPRREEKQEKGEKREKEEKREKAEKHEKRGVEVTAPIVGGLILIWLGITLFLAQYGTVSWDIWWAYFLVGLGIILIIRAILFAAIAKRIGLAYGSLVGGIVLLLIGSAAISGLKYWWAVLLVALGVFVILMALLQIRRTPRPKETT